MTKKDDDEGLKLVEQFEKIRAELLEALAPIEQLIEDYNTALEAAESVVRSRGVSVGDFQVSREFDDYDADKLRDLVGHARFLELGGYEHTEHKFAVDKRKFASFVAAGKVPQAVVSQVVKRQRHYSTPKPIRLS